MTARVLWVDTARGIAIILVVLFHSALFLAALGSDGGWLTFMKVLETFRMPLFFFAAGIFSAKILTQSFRDLWQRRLLLFVYLYVLWSLIRFVYFLVCPWVLVNSNPGNWQEFVVFPVLPGGGLWFLYALALFSLFVWVFRKVWWWFPVGISVVVSVLVGSGVVPVDNASWLKTGTYMAFFVGSVYLRDATLRFAAWLPAWLAIILVASYAVAGPAFWVLDPLHTIPGVRFVVSVIGVAAGVAVSVVLARIRSVRLLPYLGTQTLPIYLVHYFVIATFAAGLAVTGTTFSGLTALVAVPALAAGAIAISLIIARFCRPVRGVFDLPGWLSPRASRNLPAPAAEG